MHPTTFPRSSLSQRLLTLEYRQEIPLRCPWSWGVRRPLREALVQYACIVASEGIYLQTLLGQMKLEYRSWWVFTCFHFDMVNTLVFYKQSTTHDGDFQYIVFACCWPTYTKARIRHEFGKVSDRDTMKHSPIRLTCFTHSEGAHCRFGIVHCIFKFVLESLSNDLFDKMAEPSIRAHIISGVLSVFLTWYTVNGKAEENKIHSQLLHGSIESLEGVIGNCHSSHA